MPGGEQPRRYRDLAPRAPDGALDLDGMVPGEGPLELDVGFGRGLSIFERASAAPESRILGVEIKSKWAYKVAQRAEREGLHRVRIICGDVRELLSRSVPDGVLARAFVHFPDPWWKKRHAKRLVLQPSALDDLGRLLCDGGELFIQTDVETRAQRYLAELEAHPAFEFDPTGGLVDDNPFSSISNRERRALEDGLPIWRILAKRCKR